MAEAAASQNTSSDSGRDDAMDSDASDADSSRVLLHADELLHPLEARVERLAEEITTAEPPLPDDALVAKLNV